MKVFFEDREYRIEFLHGRRVVTVARREGNALRNRESCICNIRDASSPSPGDGTAPVIATATVTRHHRDTPNREAGRKAALTKVLVSLDIAGYALHSTAFLKARRCALWEAYFNRAPKQNWWGEGPKPVTFKQAYDAGRLAALQQLPNEADRRGCAS